MPASTITKPPTIALALIVKATDDEAPLLAQCLASVNGYIDTIYINLNHAKGAKISSKVKAVCEQYEAIIYETEWEDNFVTARQFIFDKVPTEYDWLLWLDTDDIVNDPEAINNVVAIVPEKTCGVYVKYDYAHDEFGNVTVSHWVCRLARNNGSYKWQSSFDDGKMAVHETLVQVRQVPKVANEEFKVIHKASPDRSRASLERNIKLLEGMYDQHKESGTIDPRILFYLGTHYYDAFKLADAKQCLQDYMQLSGWSEERSEALVYLGLIYAAEGKQDAAKHAYTLAWGEDYNNPRPYIELGELEYHSKRYQQAADVLEKAIAIKPKTFTVVQAPMQNTYRAYMLLAQAYVNLGGEKIELAKKFVQKALKLRPLDPEAQQSKELIESLIDTRDVTRATLRLVREIEKEGADQIPIFLKTLPHEIQINPAVINVRNHFTEPKEWKDRSIVIYVGPSTLGEWGPKSLDGTGIGGSEEAVVRLTQELTDLGWQCTVFGTPGNQEGVHDGVTWKNYWEFNPNDTYDVLVAWRSPWFFDGLFKARKQYLWLHDVMEKEEFTDQRLERMDKVIFVSQYHAELYEGVIPEDKWFVSGNGIQPEAFSKQDRDPYRLIYTSANERGLRILYDIWPDVKKAVPEATLDTYYGWDGYVTMHRDNPERMAWKSMMQKRGQELEGVTEHGRYPQNKLNIEMSKSGIFAYPCVFPEVYCISYVKALMAGCYPVTSDFAALEHYAKYGGEQVHYDPKDPDKFINEYKKTLIKALKNNKRNLPDVSEVKDKFAWATTAKSWAENFEE